jgi:hypothetical protein
MTWSQVRCRLVRVGGALQLGAFTAVAALFTASLSRTLWRESRPGCAHDAYVSCTAHVVDVGARWPAAIAGMLLALLVVTTSGRLRRAAQGLVLLVVAAGTAVFAADQARFAAPIPAICVQAAGGDCAFVAWRMHHLVVGASVGIGLGLLTIGLEAASRSAAVADQLRTRRVAGNALVVLSVPVLLIGLLTFVDSYDHSAALLWLTAAGVVFAAGLSLRFSRLSRPAAWGR